MLRTLAYAALSANPLIDWRMRRVSDTQALSILNFHKVSDDPLDVHEAMPPHVFDRLVGWLKQRFRIVTFSQLTSLAEETAPCEKPLLIISFDDGYRDFIDVAAPILRRHGVPANINVISGCIDRGEPPFNVIIKDFIFQAPAILLRETPLPGLSEGADPDDRAAAGLVASAAFKNQPIAAQRAAWRELWPRLSRFDGLKVTRLMSRRHVLQLVDEFECGAHSYDHATMNLETESYLRDDLGRCKAWWRELAGRDIGIYAFPNGGATVQQAQSALQYGYSQVLLVGEDYSTPGARVHPRLTISGRHFREVLVRAMGGPRFWKTRDPGARPA